MKKILLFTLLIMAQGFGLSANDITSANISLGTKNAASHYTYVNFDISWKNSWRTSTNESNYDGAWIFIKFRKTSSSLWQHATLNLTGHTQPTGSILKSSADGKGAWIYRDADGIGDIAFTGAKLQWNYGVDGVLDTDNVEIKLFAVEMVNIPQGAFMLGTGGSENYHFRDGAVNTPYQVASEGAITCGVAPGNLYSEGGTYWFSGILPAAFPKGYNAFWMMKYEFSEQQYVDFLNCLDLAKATVRNAGIFTGTHPNFIAPNPERAMYYLIGKDAFALLDWAAMRPITELEYEKSARGSNIVPVANEYPWGNTTAVNVSTPSNIGTSTETWGAGNIAASLSVPIRNGALASGASTRVSSGASYYGVMELGGNVWENIITGSNATGRAFTGAHGDGYLNSTADYDVANWPILATMVGFGLRGGAFADGGASAYARISDRTYADAAASGYTRSIILGGRGGRTAE